MLAHEDVAAGALLGAFTGDAAGATLEFLGRAPSATEVEHAMAMVGGGVWGTAPGQVTDDGELALCLADALQGRGSFDIEAVASNYRRWYESRPFDMGGTTARALSAQANGQRSLAQAMMSQAERRSMDSMANGSLMRAAPLGIWSSRLSFAQAIEAAMCDAALTHPNLSCLYAGAAYVAAIRHLVLRPGDTDGAFAAALQATEHPDGAEVRAWLDDADLGRGPACYPMAGFVRIAFIHAFLHLRRGSSYEEAIRETLLGGGDTDTNACIVGGLVGAVHGLAGLPEPMWRAVVECDTREGRPRPDWLSTRNALQLAHRLLA